MEGIRRVAVVIARAPFTHRAWRDVARCLAGAITGVAGFILVVGTLLPAFVVTVSVVGTAVGLLVIVGVLRLARLVAAVQRRILRVASPAPFVPGSGALGRLDRRLRDRDAWRAVGYVLVKFPVTILGGYAVAAVGIGVADCTYPLVWALFRHHPAGTRLGPIRAIAPVPQGHLSIYTWPGTLVAVLIGAACVLAGMWLARGVVIADKRLARVLLGPSRVSELERTRAIAVEEAMAALRRVERDLHDGAQVRLAAVTMNLGMAREKAGDDAVRGLLDAAQTGTAAAMADLRRIVRGIHPPVLEVGLADALASLAAASPIPVTVRADLTERPAQAIETIAYFCVAELLANAIKYSSANSIEIILESKRRGVLQMRVTDDGRGGADPSLGTGLDGLRQRVSTVDGSLRLSSPPGGPTVVSVELPLRIRGV